jgi:hypothetical protein
MLYNYMNYKKLETQSINTKIKKQKITRDDLIEYLQNTYRTTAFSTFPYIANNYNSIQSLERTNSGNCVSLSMRMQQQLKTDKNIDSYLIPATIPKRFFRSGYLHISHIALAIPYTTTKVYIVDPAFYFLEPISISITKNSSNKTIVSSDIYKDSIESIYSKTYKLSKKKVFNKYQALPSNTIVCECYYGKYPDDRWSYFLRTVVDPDYSISTFFINARKERFITTTDVDNYGKCRKMVDLRMDDTDQIMAKVEDDVLYDGSVDMIPENIIDILNDLLYGYFDTDIYDYLKSPVKSKYLFRL